MVRDSTLVVEMQDFLVEDRLISPVGDHLTGPLAEPKATILTRPSSCWQGGLDFALHDEARPGKPKRYEADVEAQVTALACSAPPPGAERWTIALLTEAARRHPGMKSISRETVRRVLKKTSSSPGAS